MAVTTHYQYRWTFLCWCWSLSSSPWSCSRLALSSWSWKWSCWNSIELGSSRPTRSSPLPCAYAEKVQMNKWTQASNLRSKKNSILVKSNVEFIFLNLVIVNVEEVLDMVLSMIWLSSVRLCMLVLVDMIVMVMVEFLQVKYVQVSKNNLLFLLHGSRMDNGEEGDDKIENLFFCQIDLNHFLVLSSSQVLIVCGWSRLVSFLPSDPTPRFSVQF